MTWTDRLKHFSGFAAAVRPVETTTLLPMMITALDRLHRVAALAPTPALQSDVLPVTRKADGVVQRVRDILRDFGSVPPSARHLSGEPGGHNHWARLLQALEQHREVRQRLREVSIAVEDTTPDLSRVLAEIGREQEVVVEQLRDLIARADPQALN
jgi:hypothetical protein